MECPQRLQAIGLAGIQPVEQGRDGGGIVAFNEKLERGLALPLQRRIKEGNEVHRLQVSIIPTELWQAGARLGAQPVDSPIAHINVPLLIPRMRHLAVIPVGDVDRAVGTDLDVHGTEPRVAARHDALNVARLEGRAFGRDVAEDDAPLQRFDAEELSVVALRQRAAVVNDEVVREAFALGAVHVREVTERIRIRELAVFLETFAQIRALHVVEAARVAAVVPGEKPAFVIELHAERVAAAFREHLVTLRLRVIAPDVLALRIHGVRLAGAADVSCHRAALRGVEPAVRSPAQAVHDRMRVFETEAFEMHHRISVRHVVVILVGIEQQVRRIQYPDSAAPFHARRRDVQPIDERLVLVEHAVAIGVFVDGDLVTSLHATRRRFGNLVIDRAPEVVAAHGRQAGRRRVLQILHDPHPAAFIEVQEDRLAHDRLGEHLLDFQIVWNRE